MEKALAEYEAAVGDSFPMFVYAWASENEIIDIIKTCVKAGKDVYDMGFLTLSSDVDY